MTTRHFCTYFDHNYLPRGMILLESLHEHCPEAHVHVLCLSDECHAALTALAYPHVSPLRLAELEAADPELAAARSTRSLIEYYFTITPCLPWHLLTRCEGIDEVTYLDADMMFFSSPEPIFEEAVDASIIMTPHRFPARLKHLEEYGKYNVSWLTFRKTGDGMACLAWYREACLEWCKDVVEADRFADQKYLDVFPQRFTGVHVMRHAGGGVAPWNIEGSALREGMHGSVIDGVPLVFYHAQGFKRIWGPFFSSGLGSYGADLHDIGKRTILALYARCYVRAERRVPRSCAVRRFSDPRSKAGLLGVLWRTGKRLIVDCVHKSLVVQY